MVIDCHVHLSMFGHEGRNYRQIRDSLLSRMARSGVDYAFVFPDSEPNTGVADLNTTREVIRDWPNLLMLGAVSIPLIDAEIVNELDVLAEAGDIIGIKLYPDDERCRAVYELCQRHNLPVVFHSGETMNEPWREQYNHPHQIAKVAQRYPTMRILVAHFSQPHLEACRDVVLNHRHVYADIFVTWMNTCGWSDPCAFQTQLRISSSRAMQKGSLHSSSMGD
jgi:predicted TIM-barrel fold metal-dependent hydrolase